MSVKKAYTNIIAFLEVNADKKVKSILDELIELCSAKSAGSSTTSVYRNDAGEVTFVRCGYFKQWLPVAHVAFGAKVGSASGLSPMSKEGTSLWTKQQRVAKAAKDGLLEQVAAGDVEAGDLGNLMQEIETARLTVVGHPLGFETIEEALATDVDSLAADLSNAAEAA